MFYCIVTMLWPVKGRPNSIEKSLILRWCPPNPHKASNFSDFWKLSTWLQSKDRTANFVNLLFLSDLSCDGLQFLTKWKFENTSLVSVWTSEWKIFHYLSKERDKLEKRLLESSVCRTIHMELLVFWASRPKINMHDELSLPRKRVWRMQASTKAFVPWDSGCVAKKEQWLWANVWTEQRFIQPEVICLLLHQLWSLNWSLFNGYE